MLLISYLIRSLNWGIHFIRLLILKFIPGQHFSSRSAVPRKFDGKLCQKS